MKRAGGLFPRIIEPENIRIAFLNAAKSKRNRQEIIKFTDAFDNNIKKIYQQLKTLDLKVGNYRFFTVYDPKMRHICAAEFSERVLHHAIMNICEPVLEKNAIYDSYACRKEKGSVNALKRTQYFARKNPWYMKMDICKYFDSIDHHILKELLSRRIKDKPVLSLFDQILSTYSIGPGKGLPIGNLVSQHLANFYLNSFDHWIREEIKTKGYVRYMDDFIVFGENSRELKEKREYIRYFLKEILSLELKANTQINRCGKGIPFLGFIVYPGKIRLSANSRKRFIRKFRSYEHKMITGEWEEITVARHVTALVAFTKTADAKAFRRSVIQRYGVSP